MRDIGLMFAPTPRRRFGGRGDWVFNGWGAQDWARWDRDEIGATVAGLADIPVIASPLVNEGGGIQVDGEGTVLVTETVQLDPGRNLARPARTWKRNCTHHRSDARRVVALGLTRFRTARQPVVTSTRRGHHLARPPAANTQAGRESSDYPVRQRDPRCPRSDAHDLAGKP